MEAELPLRLDMENANLFWNVFIRCLPPAKETQKLWRKGNTCVSIVYDPCRRVRCYGTTQQCLPLSVDCAVPLATMATAQVILKATRPCVCVCVRHALANAHLFGNHLPLTCLSSTFLSDCDLGVSSQQTLANAHAHSHTPTHTNSQQCRPQCIACQTSAACIFIFNFNDNSLTACCLTTRATAKLMDRKLGDGQPSTGRPRQQILQIVQVPHTKRC